MIFSSKLEKQWALTAAELDAARSLIASQGGINDEVARYLEQYEEYLEHNELELALDMLEEAGEVLPLPEAFWRRMMKAAEIMGLSDRFDGYREKIGNAEAGG